MRGGRSPCHSEWTIVVPSGGPRARSSVIPSGGSKARSRGIASIPVERVAIPRLAALARKDYSTTPSLPDRLDPDPHQIRRADELYRLVRPRRRREDRRETERRCRRVNETARQDAEDGPSRAAQPERE